jgi:hypothetical protein
MNTSRTTRFASLVAVAAIGLMHAGTAGAAPKAGVPMFTDRAAAQRAELPALAKADSGVVGTMNPTAMSASAVELTLANGARITAQLQRVARDDGNATQSWIGTFEDSPGSLLVLTKSKGVVTGFGNYGETMFEVRPTAGNKHVAFELDSTKLPRADEVKKNVTGAADLLGTTVDYGSGGTTSLVAGDAIVHDVLILYTASSAAKWGQATLASMIQSAVQAANQAYVNSQVNVTLNVVGLQQGPINEGSGMGATVNALKTNSTVRALRDSLAADMVVLINENTDYCGYADLWYSYSGTTTNWDAYAGVQSGCLSMQAFAHEIGHLQQLDHNRENVTGLAAYAYSYGYRLCTSDGFRDIMSYPCSSGGSTRINYFSNPSLTFNGYPIGISYESNPSKAADSARSLRETAMTAAAYRVRTTTSTLPAAPTGLVAQNVAYDRVSLAWTDNSSNETGFKVERSTDSVNFVEVASLGAGSRSYTDVAVAANSRYSYRLRAYNSYGGSAYSNIVSVTTPSVPVTGTAPAAPTGMVAQNVAYDSVSVTWTDNSSDETGFKVERSTDGVNFAALATLGSGSRAYTDTSVAAASRYSYRVRAYNSYGGSAYSNIVSVTTPSVPVTATAPPAPTSIAATNSGDGSAVVNWSAGTTTATSFEIRRSKYDSRKRVWSAYSLAATVPVSVTSIADSVGEGTFRYTVRAVNTGGASASAGPAEVTVTSPSASKRRNTKNN